MTAFALGLIFGVTFGILLMGFLNLAAYDRGFDAANRRRAAWLPAATHRAIARRNSAPTQRIARAAGA